MASDFLLKFDSKQGHPKLKLAYLSDELVWSIQKVENCDFAIEKPLSLGLG